jgi:hypothetical protein
MDALSGFYKVWRCCISIARRSGSRTAPVLGISTQARRGLSCVPDSRGGGGPVPGEQGSVLEAVSTPRLPVMPRRSRFRDPAPAASTWRRRRPRRAARSGPARGLNERPRAAAAITISPAAVRRGVAAASDRRGARRSGCGAAAGRSGESASGSAMRRGWKRTGRSKRTGAQPRARHLAFHAVSLP